MSAARQARRDARSRTRVRDLLQPVDFPANRVVACLGLIADTHMPDRCLTLPPSLFEVFRGVDLILHAGDIGRLAVLDELSAAAPVVAVHGNDERYDETPRELPYQQVLSLAGHRVFLTHGHHPDLAQEMELRRDDRWGPKLARRAGLGRQAGAGIVVYGHTHVPTNVARDGVWLVNPGALASGGLHTRPRYQTVALLYLRDDGVPATVHVDLSHPDRPFRFEIDWAAGFLAAHEQFEVSILAPDLIPTYERLRRAAASLEPAVANRMREAIREVALRCWSGEQSAITRQDLLSVVDRVQDLPAQMRQQCLEILAPGQAGRR